MMDFYDVASLTPQTAGPAVINYAPDVDGQNSSATSTSVFPQTVSGSLCWYYYNKKKTGNFKAIWRAELFPTAKMACRVYVWIPTLVLPSGLPLTQNASYEITYAGSSSPITVTLNQRARGGLGWTPLCTLPSPLSPTVCEFPFTPGGYEVRLTNVTGEDNGTTIVVANAIAWVNV